LYTEDPEQLEQVLDRLGSIETPDFSDPLDAKAFADLQVEIDGYRESLSAADRATRSVATETSFLDQILRGAAAGQQAASEAADNLANNIERAGAETELFSALVGDMDAKLKAFSASIGSSTALDDFLSSGLALNDSLSDLRETVGQLPADLDAGGIAFQGLSEDGSQALNNLLSLGRSVQGTLENALQFGGAEAVTAQADQIREELRGVFAQVGITGERFDEYLEVLGLTPEQIDTAITVSGDAEARAKIEAFQNTAELLEAPIELQVAVAEAQIEGRLGDASNLIQAWYVDQQDGLIDNPFLVTLGLGDTSDAENGIDGFKRGEESKPPMELPVGADTTPAIDRLANLRQAIPLFSGSIAVSADTSSAIANLQALQRAIPLFGVSGAGNIPGGFDVKIGRRATGGPVDKDANYFVNEPSLGGELFRPSTDGFVMNAGDTDRLISGVEALVSGTGSGVTVNQQIVTADPVVAGSESARKMRDAQFLAGV
jgi:hypothetical protein